MIYTVTFNPAIDYCLGVETVEFGKTNRSVNEQMFFGGKGINVSLVLKELETPSVALGFVAGFTGTELEKQLNLSGINTDFIHLSKGNTRINVKLKGSVETEINANGPEISSDEVAGLFEKLKKLQNGDTLVLAGSIPNSLESDIYEKILESICQKQVRVVIDATKDLLLNTLKFKPFLIKPNLQELEEIFEKTLETDEKIVECAKVLQQKGAKNVLVSLGENGAIFVCENGKVYNQKALGGKAVNTVGAGDSMIAGFLSGIEKGFDYALKLSCAAAGATATTQTLATKEKILELM